MSEHWTLHTRLRLGCGPGYEAAHRAIPADVDAAMRDAGCEEWVIRRRGEILTHTVTARSRSEMEAALHDDPANRAWQAEIGAYLSTIPVAPHETEGHDPGAVVWSFDLPTR